MKDFSRWFRIAVSVAACLLLLRLLNWTEVAGVLKRAQFIWLLLVFVVIHLDRLLMSYKWTLLLKRSGSSVTTGTAIKAYYVSFFWSTFLPSTVGADALRVGWLSRKERGRTILAFSIIVERILGSLALGIVAIVCFAVLSLHSRFWNPALPVLIVIVLLVSAGSFLAVFSLPVHNALRKLFVRLRLERAEGIVQRTSIAAAAFKEKPGLLMIFLILSVFEQVFPITSVYFLAKALAVELPLLWVAVGVPIILMVSRLPISFNGIGVQEGAFAFVFSLAGVSVSESVLMSVADRIMLLVASVPGAIWTGSFFDRKKAVVGVDESSAAHETPMAGEHKET